MAHVLVAVMPLDTQLSHIIQSLQHAGFQRLGFIIGNPVAGDEAVLGVAPAPEAAAVMQLLQPDRGFTVKGLGYVTVSGVAGELARYKDHEAADFLTALLGHDADATTVDSTVDNTPVASRDHYDVTVDARGEFELVPRIGQMRIAIGNGEELDQRFAKLRGFYAKGIAQGGWRKYARIDLRFTDQVVATERTPS